MTLVFVLLAGCSTLNVNEALNSMNTDLDKKALTLSDYYLKLANNYFEQNKYDDAIEDYQLSLLHNNKNNEARFGLAQSYSALENNEMALSEFNRYLDQNEGLLDGSAVLTDKQINVLTYFFEKSGSLERIYEINKSQYEKTRFNSRLWKMYELCLRLKNYEQAFEVLNLLASNKDQLETASKALINLSKAEIYTLQKNNEKAMKELEAAELEKPLDEMLLKKKIQVLTDLQRWHEVILTGQKYIKYQKHTIPVSESIVTAAVKIEDYQLAIDELEWQSGFVDDTQKNNIKEYLNQLISLRSKNDKNKNDEEQRVPAQEIKLRPITKSISRAEKQTACTPITKPVKYLVHQGDHIAAILRTLQLEPVFGKNNSLDQLLKLNTLNHPDLLEPGQEITVPIKCDEQISVWEIKDRGSDQLLVRKKDSFVTINHKEIKPRAQIESTSEVIEEMPTTIEKSED